MTTQQIPPPAYPGFQPYIADPGKPYAQPAYAPGTAPPYPQQSFAPGATPPYPQQTYVAGGTAPYPQTYIAGPGEGAYPQAPFIQPGGMNYPQPPPPAGMPAGFVNMTYNPTSEQSHVFPENNGFDEEPKDATTDWRGFTDKAIRAVFVRKVYAILMVQLTFTLGIICLFVFEKHVNHFVRRNFMAYILAYVIFLGVYIALLCCGNLRRKYPTNIILLSIFTAAESYMLGAISSFHETRIVVMAVGICAAVCLVVSVFSFHSKFDFTSCGGVLFVLCWVLFIFGIIAIFTWNKIMTTVYGALGAMLFTAFLAYDTQMIMGGKKHELSAEEHIFAAICLYLDIVYMFRFLLLLLGSNK